MDATTSVGWCMPRYTLLRPTAAGMTTARARAMNTKVGRQLWTTASTAIMVHSTNVARVCPLGKLDVGGAESSCATAGRGRSTAHTTMRNIAISPAIATNTSTTPSYARRNRLTRTTDTPIATITDVVAAALKNAVVRFNSGVRSDTNHVESSASAPVARGSCHPTTIAITVSVESVTRRPTIQCRLSVELRPCRGAAAACAIGDMVLAYPLTTFSNRTRLTARGRGYRRRVPVVIAVLVATVVVTTVLVVVERVGRVRDPADVRGGTSGIVREAQRHPRFRQFVLRRANPHEATGLLLTVTLSAIAIATIVVGLVLQMVQSHDGFARWDNSAARWGATHTTGGSETVIRWVTQLGSTPGILLVVVVVAIVEHRRIPSLSAPIFLAVVVGSELIVNNLIKVIVRRDRPDIARLVAAGGYSFPSGHTAAAAATYAAVALLLGRRRSHRTRALLAAAAAGVTVAVASSRVLLGAHWLTDVIAGAAVGWSCFALCSIAFGGRLLNFGEPVESARDRLATPGDAGRPDPITAGSATHDSDSVR